jgi:hypothetical protein
LRPAIWTSREHKRIARTQGQCCIEWDKLTDRRHASGKESGCAILQHSNNGIDPILVASECSGHGVASGRRSGEYHVSILATDTGHQNEIIGQEVDVSVSVGWTVVVFGRGRRADIDCGG